MPKGKKKFIDRKNAVTFHLVHRSQQDPLIADETAPQHVLVPVAPEKKTEVSVKKRKEEQRKYGIFFDDDYNYLQHLRDASEMGVDWEAVPRQQHTKAGQRSPHGGQEDESPLNGPKIKLPSSVFASEIEDNVGLLNKAAPRSGLCLDLDPDVVAAMDEDFDFEDPDNILEDNFIELANKVCDSDGEYSDISSTAETGEDTGDEAYSNEEDDVGSLNGSQFTFTQEEVKSRFTNYSMSSSVIRRNEQLSLLDMRFEKLYEGYDDNDIGALDCEEIEGNIAPDSEFVMQFANEFEEEKTAKLQETDKTLALIENLCSDTEDSEMECIEISEKATEKWDCESILSTYSNLYNHPKLITEPKISGRIKVSGRTGIPLDVLDSNKLTSKTLAKLDSNNYEENKIGRAESVISMLSALSVRPKNESREEKKDRKKAIKLYRKERRLERKANTLAFKEEKKRQEKVLLNVKANQQGVKMI
ncbi:protein LTV1 homolog [Anabrus simplex]|uniref:protein LTV1 homolog n=1 Tax=Anabrus simplex TaxID=316456 RepID=UPI0035A2E4DF